MSLRDHLLPASLNRQLTLYYAVAFFLFLGASFLSLYWSIGAILGNRMDKDLTEDITEFTQMLAVSGAQELIEEMDKEALADERESVFLMLYQSDGSLIHATDAEHWPGLNPDLNLLDQQFHQPTKRSFQTLQLPARANDTRLVYAALSPEYAMIIGESNDERDDIMEVLGIAFSLVFLLALPLASLLVWLLTRKSLAGIQSVSNAARDIKAGNLNRRVNARNQVVEVQTLADTFDSMAERIQKLIRNMREMTDNMTHDLRSPLGRVRLLSESVLNASSTETDFRQAAEDTIAECDRLIKMINISLDVAETEAGVAAAVPTEFDFSQLASDACELFEAVADEKDIVIEKQLGGQCGVKGDINSVQRMVANVLDNAVKFTPIGGTIRVSLANSDNQLALSIVDSGIGIEATNFENIFNRFFRVEPSRTSSGCGLGLSYARAVARAHNGDIQVKSREAHYTEFVISMPCTSPESEQPGTVLVPAWCR